MKMKYWFFDQISTLNSWFSKILSIPKIYKLYMFWYLLFMLSSPKIENLLSHNTLCFIKLEFNFENLGNFFSWNFLNSIKDIFFFRWYRWNVIWPRRYYYKYWNGKLAVIFEKFCLKFFYEKMKGYLQQLIYF